MKVNKGFSYSLIVLIFLSFASCASDSDFLMKRTSNSAKAQLLVNAGADAYAKMTESTDVSRIKEINEYFVVALRYDPENADAKRYVARLKGYSDLQYRNALSELKRLVERKDRKEADDLRMGVLVQRVRTINPSAEEARVVSSKAEPAINSTVNNYNARVQAILTKVRAEKDEKRKEALLIEAFAIAGKALAANPNNGGAVSNMSALKESVEAIINKRLGGIDDLLKKRSFTLARGQIDSVATMSKQFGDTFDQRITDSYFNLYYQWSNYLFETKEYVAAGRRIDNALEYGTSPGLVDLQARNLRAQKNQANANKPAEPVEEAVPFDVILGEIDMLITEKSWAQAMWSIRDSLQSGEWPDQQEVLVNRRAKVMAAVASLYEQGVKAYREERFADAIKLFSQVEKINGSYEQSSDYLQKATEKKKFLDQF